MLSAVWLILDIRWMYLLSLQVKTNNIVLVPENSWILQSLEMQSQIDPSTLSDSLKDETFWYGRWVPNETSDDWAWADTQDPGTSWSTWTVSQPVILLNWSHSCFQILTLGLLLGYPFNFPIWF